MSYTTRILSACALSAALLAGLSVLAAAAASTEDHYSASQPADHHTS